MDGDSGDEGNRFGNRLTSLPRSTVHSQKNFVGTCVVISVQRHRNVFAFGVCTSQGRSQMSVWILNVVDKLSIWGMLVSSTVAG